MSQGQARINKKETPSGVFVHPNWRKAATLSLQTRCRWGWAETGGCFTHPLKLSRISAVIELRQRGNICVCFIFPPIFFLLFILQDACRAKRTHHPTHPLFPAPKLSEPHTAFTSQTYLSVDEEGTIIHKRFESDAANQCGEKKPRKDERGDAVTVMEVMMEMVMRSRAAP